MQLTTLLQNQSNRLIPDTSEHLTTVGLGEVSVSTREPSEDKLQTSSPVKLPVSTNDSYSGGLHLYTAYRLACWAQVLRYAQSSTRNQSMKNGLCPGLFLLGCFSLSSMAGSLVFSFLPSQRSFSLSFSVRYSRSCF